MSLQSPRVLLFITHIDKLLSTFNLPADLRLPGVYYPGVYYPEVYYPGFQAESVNATAELSLLGF